MKYSDQQRIQKIYEKAVKLNEYIIGHQIKKEELLTEIPLQWLVATCLLLASQIYILMADGICHEYRASPSHKAA